MKTMIAIAALLASSVSPADETPSPEAPLRPQHILVQDSMRLIHSNSDSAAAAVCKRYGYTLYWRLLRSNNTPTAEVWCLRSRAGLPNDARVFTVDGKLAP
jgi:hypothetical protein